ncbi:tyrosine recombinase XerC [mine drainage metagenome]|uniref:Tyrosine recombinase XerC n=1 Tax=mine drainage metagenome TaxID=410659 RepID=A0A1J5S5C2_9ZZZZ
MVMENNEGNLDPDLAIETEHEQQHVKENVAVGRKLPPAKPGRIDGKNSAHKSGGFIPKRLNSQIEIVLQQHKDEAAHKDKKVGQGTQDKRRTVIKGFFADLIRMRNPRYSIKSIYNLKQKHLRAVFIHLEKKGQAPSTIQNKISIMRTFCEWIGKYGMVGDSFMYVEDRASVRRTMVVQEDKSWEGNGINVLDLIQKVTVKDETVGMWLELCLGFGLRVREAILYRPSIDGENGNISVREGTKGDRPRTVPIENDVQRDILQRAKALADGKTGRLGIRGKTYEQKRRRFYTVLESIGITLRDEGVSAHGLRHQYMQESFKRLTGQDAPVKGGDINDIPADEFHVATLKLVERAGHTRPTIGASYYGSRRRKKPQQAKVSAEVDESVS